MASALGKHVFGVAALQSNAGGSYGILAQFFLASQAPLAGAVSFLHPAYAYAVSNFAGRDAGANFDNLAHRFVAKHMGKLDRDQAVR